MMDKVIIWLVTIGSTILAAMFWLAFIGSVASGNFAQALGFLAFSTIISILPILSWKEALKTE